MSDVQAQLDEFARELAALNAKFEFLRREASLTTTDAPAARPASDVPAWLRPIDDLFWSGEHKRALRKAEEMLAHGIGGYSTEARAALLATLRDYLRRIDTPEWKRRDALIDAIDFSLAREGKPAPRQPFPAATAKPATTATPAPRPIAPREPRPPRKQLELDLLGPRALAIAGGIVTLLGIVFFFVLAVNRGWIGPHARVALGGIASVLVFAAGLELKRRYGTTHSALAAVGAGLAGGYATLLSAAALYDMLSPWEALLVAVAIAATGLATALAWRSEIVAGIGLLGAMLVPAFVAAQGGVSVLPVAFVAVVFAVLATVSIRLDWRGLLIAGGLASAPQLLALTFAPKYAHQSPASVIAVVAVLFVLYAATGCVRQLRVAGTTLDVIATAFVLGAGLTAGGSLARLLETNEQRGVALLLLAGAYALPAAFFFARERTRDLGALLAFATFTLVAVGTALLLNGDGLTYAWAAEAVGLAWLARRTHEIRFQLWSRAYVTLALIHALIDAPPRDLWDATAHHAAGVGTILAVAVAAAVDLRDLVSPAEAGKASRSVRDRGLGKIGPHILFSSDARPWSEDDLPAGGRLLEDFYEGFAARQRPIRLATAWLTLVLSVYATSLGVLAVFSSFAWGTVANVALWMVVGLIVLAFGFRRDVEHLRLGALGWLALTGLLALVEASHLLTENPRAVAFAIVGVAALVASFAYGMSRCEGIDRPTVMSVSLALLSVSLFVYPTGYRLEDQWAGVALLGLAALYAALSSVLVLRHARDASTAYWAIAIVLAIFADPLLLDGTFVVLGWAALGVAVAWLGGRVREPRLFIGAAAPVALAVVQAVAIQAPLTHLFTTRLHPANGTASIFIAALAVSGLAYFARSELARLGAFRTAVWWLVGVLTVYGTSLLILELVEWISSAGLHTEFQRGQTAVSALWGLLGLVLLYAGLKWHRRPLRIAGLACFPISLAKIFLYDLPSLSSVTRALSFLAVGAVLLLGGFFYQRLMSDRDDLREGDTIRS